MINIIGRWTINLHDLIKVSTCNNSYANIIKRKGEERLTKRRRGRGEERMRGGRGRGDWKGRKRRWWYKEGRWQRGVNRVRKVASRVFLKIYPVLRAGCTHTVCVGVKVRGGHPCYVHTAVVGKKGGKNKQKRGKGSKGKEKKRQGIAFRE